MVRGGKSNSEKRESDEGIEEENSERRKRLEPSTSEQAASDHFSSDNEENTPLLPTTNPAVANPSSSGSGLGPQKPTSYLPFGGVWQELPEKRITVKYSLEKQKYLLNTDMPFPFEKPFQPEDLFAFRDAVCKEFAGFGHSIPQLRFEGTYFTWRALTEKQIAETMETFINRLVENDVIRNSEIFEKFIHGPDDALKASEINSQDSFDFTTFKKQTERLPRVCESTGGTEQVHEELNDVGLALKAMAEQDMSSNATNESRGDLLTLFHTEQEQYELIKALGQFVEDVSEERWIYQAMVDRYLSPPKITLEDECSASMMRKMFAKNPNNNSKKVLDVVDNVPIEVRRVKTARFKDLLAPVLAYGKSIGFDGAQVIKIIEQLQPGSTEAALIEKCKPKSRLKVIEMFNSLKNDENQAEAEANFPEVEANAAAEADAANVQQPEASQTFDNDDAFLWSD